MRAKKVVFRADDTMALGARGRLLGDPVTSQDVPTSAPPGATCWPVR